MASRRFLKNQHGFGLLEISVAAGLGLVIAAATTQMLINQAKMSRSIDLNGKINNETALARIVMQSEASCAQNLATNLPAGTLLSAGRPAIQIPKIDYGGTPLLVKQTNFPSDKDYFVSDLTLENFVENTTVGSTTGRIWTAVLKIVYNKRNVIGAQANKTDVNMQIRTNAAGTVIGCSATDLVFSSPQITDICTRLGGTWDTTITPAACVGMAASPTAAADPAVTCTSLGGTWNATATPPSCTGIGGTAGGGVPSGTQFVCQQLSNDCCYGIGYPTCPTGLVVASTASSCQWGHGWCGGNFSVTCCGLQ